MDMLPGGSTRLELFYDPKCLNRTKYAGDISFVHTTKQISPQQEKIDDVRDSLLS
jgi:hypothetical protein